MTELASETCLPTIDIDICFSLFSHSMTDLSWPLFVQRLRSLSQDERRAAAAHQAAKETGGVAPTRPVLLELRHHHHHLVASQQRGRGRLQRLRPLLQAAQREPAARHAKGGHPDQKTQTQTE